MYSKIDQKGSAKLSRHNPKQFTDCLENTQLRPQKPHQEFASCNPRLITSQERAHRELAAQETSQPKFIGALSRRGTGLIQGWHTLIFLNS